MHIGAAPTQVGAASGIETTPLARGGEVASSVPSNIVRASIEASPSSPRGVELESMPARGRGVSVAAEEAELGLRPPSRRICESLAAVELEAARLAPRPSVAHACESLAEVGPEAAR